VIVSDNFRVAILIVGFRNPEDVQACLTALIRLAAEPRFDIFVCENGGGESFNRLYDALTGPLGPCTSASNDLSVSLASPSERLVEVKCLALKGRPSRVWIGCASQNLGYAGGINVWVQRLLPISNWHGFWVLNPDAEPEPGALRALVQRAVGGNKGMVGSTIVATANRNYVHCRAGHRWRKLRTSLALIGLGEPINGPVDLQATEAALDCIAGGSMYVTRACLEKIGLMEERFFLFYEDADWSIRAKKHGLGYAPDSIVPHRGGTTIGSARLRAERSRLSVYLESRNHLHFVRMHWHRYLPFAFFQGCVYATTYLFALSPKNFKAAVAGLYAAMKGETGQPKFHA
jgi:N-acetylglucosaminyl-diphospho-decaprenol L-rhamnosyltransferase